MLFRILLFAAFILMNVNEPDISNPETAILEYDFVNPRARSWVKGQRSRSYSRFNILLIHMPFVPCQSDHPIRKYSYLKIWSWKYKLKIMDWVKGQDHIRDPTSYQLISLLVPVVPSDHSSILEMWLDIQRRTKDYVRCNEILKIGKIERHFEKKK